MRLRALLFTARFGTEQSEASLSVSPSLPSVRSNRTGNVSVIAAVADALEYAFADVLPKGGRNLLVRWYPVGIKKQGKSAVACRLTTRRGRRCWRRPGSAAGRGVPSRAYLVDVEAVYLGRQVAGDLLEVVGGSAFGRRQSCMRRAGRRVAELWVVHEGHGRTWTRSTSCSTCKKIQIQTSETLGHFPH